MSERMSDKAPLYGCLIVAAITLLIFALGIAVYWRALS